MRISIAGVVARVSVAQRFRNSGADWIEAIYAFRRRAAASSRARERGPLTDDAAVNRLTMRVGDRTIEGEIRERETAERIYRDARDTGHRASLVQQQAG